MADFKHVLVTGGTGKAGRAVVADLLAHGYRVRNIDTARPASPTCPFLKTDLTDFGQTMAAISHTDGQPDKVDAIVHLAAIPAPGMVSNAETFRINMVSTFNVFEAARVSGIRNVVWASSETVLGLPFDAPPPYIPVDEEYPARPESAYSLSKHLGEQMAEQFCRWDPTFKIIGLRFSNIMEPADYARFDSWQNEPKARKWNLWGYIDARDAAQSVRRSLQADLTGAEVFVIANADTVMRETNDKLVGRLFPGISQLEGLANHNTLLSIDKAKRVLGYAPEFGWSGR